ncbi:hypothetical protein ACEOAJ_18115, partial [Escherichia coli]|uniref:hypothetical protein n=1 Tax=Escherichia coli TaxID=562 RepID=UPI00358DCDA4
LTETVQVLGFSSASVASGNAVIVGCGMNALSDLHSTELVGLIRHNSVASGNAVIVGCGVSALSDLHTALNS